MIACQQLDLSAPLHIKTLKACLVFVECFYWEGLTGQPCPWPYRVMPIEIIYPISDIVPNLGILADADPWDHCGYCLYLCKLFLTLLSLEICALCICYNVAVLHAVYI